MSTCYILCDLPNQHKAQFTAQFKATAAANAVAQLGYNCIILNKDCINLSLVASLETQSGTQDAQRVAYSRAVLDRLEESKKGDLIIATASWHQDCFNGLLSLEGGRYRGLPVIEMWIDYPNSFANWRIFASRFTKYSTATAQSQAFTERWITASPSVSRSSKKLDAISSAISVWTDLPHSLNFLEASISGVPVVAPAWGVWEEYIVNGVTGILYRTEQGRIKALEVAQSLASRKIVEAIQAKFTLDKSVEQIEGFLTRLSDER